MSVLQAGEKVALLRSYAQRFGLWTMVETGVYMGSCSGLQMLDDLESLVVIDYQQQNIDRLPNDPRLLACLGDSAGVLPILLAERSYDRWINGPALFWLDAHAIDANEGAPSCPLRLELEAIVSWAHGAGSVILIDDLRLMQPESEYVRELGWPTLGELRELADAPGFWICEEGDDIMRLTPRRGAAVPESKDKDKPKDEEQQKKDGGKPEPASGEQQENPELYAEMQARGLRAC